MVIHVSLVDTSDLVAAKLVEWPLSIVLHISWLLFEEEYLLCEFLLRTSLRLEALRLLLLFGLFFYGRLSSQTFALDQLCSVHH